ncbi:FkbM family methyltransferase [Patescibacteria group bacterium]|nr:FkbM family methyltransferase [Patescibacteria group bacterium]
MPFVAILRKIYRKWIYLPWLDKLIYTVLDTATDIYSFTTRYSFPSYYIRRFKLNMLWQLYEKETVQLFKKIIKPKMIVMDIGAHIGYFTRIFSKLAGTDGVVYAFEADPENFQLLIKNTKHLKNTKLCKAAITDSTGIIDFFHSNIKSGCHSIVPAEFRSQKIAVPAITLDEFAQRKGINKIDIIKMDIEGGEYLALQGMKKIFENNPDIVLVLEFCLENNELANINSEKFLKQMEEFGLSIFAIRQNKLDKVTSSSSVQEITQGADFINLYCTKK